MKHALQTWGFFVVFLTERKATWKRRSLLQKLAATLGKKLRELKKSEWDDNANATPSLITNSLNFFSSLACTKTLPPQTHTNIHLLNNTQWKTPVRDGSLRCYKSGSFHRLTTWHTTDSERKRSEAEKSKRNNRSGLMKQQIQEKRTEEGKANNMELIKSQSIQSTSQLLKREDTSFSEFTSIYITAFSVQTLMLPVVSDKIIICAFILGKSCIWLPCMYNHVSSWLKRLLHP